MQLGGNGPFPSTRPPRKLASDKARTILIAEDEPAIRDLLAMILEMEGYAVLKARHGMEALLFSREFPDAIHLLITDYRMRPEMNGLDLARQLRRERPEVRVIFVSGFVGNDSLQPEMESSDARFLHKPFVPAAILEAVRSALETAV